LVSSFLHLWQLHASRNVSPQQSCDVTRCRHEFTQKRTRCFEGYVIFISVANSNMATATLTRRAVVRFNQGRASGIVTM